MTRTTADLKNAAYEAQRACRWTEAATLYTEAIRRYPVDVAQGALGQADIAAMQEWVDEMKGGY